MRKFFLATLSIVFLLIGIQILNISNSYAEDIYSGTTLSGDNNNLCYVFICNETIKQSSYIFAKDNLKGVIINVDAKYVQNGKLVQKVKYKFDKLGDYYWEYRADDHNYNSPVYPNTYQYNMLRECVKKLGMKIQTRTTRGMQLVY